MTYCCLLDFMVRKLPSIMLKILKVIRFKTKSSVAQYFKAYLHLKIIFTWLKNGLKLVKLHFCHQIQFSFYIHNLDSVWESKHCPKFSPFLLSLKRSSLSKLSILQLIYLSFRAPKSLSQKSQPNWSQSSQSITKEKFWSWAVC